MNRVNGNHFGVYFIVALTVYVSNSPLLAFGQKAITLSNFKAVRQDENSAKLTWSLSSSDSQIACLLRITQLNQLTEMNIANCEALSYVLPVGDFYRCNDIDLELSIVSKDAQIENTSVHATVTFSANQILISKLKKQVRKYTNDVTLTWTVPDKSSMCNYKFEIKVDGSEQAIINGTPVFLLTKLIPEKRYRVDVTVTYDDTTRGNTLSLSFTAKHGGSEAEAISFNIELSVGLIRVKLIEPSHIKTNPVEYYAATLNSEEPSASEELEFNITKYTACESSIITVWQVTADMIESPKTKKPTIPFPFHPGKPIVKCNVVKDGIDVSWSLASVGNDECRKDSILTWKGPSGLATVINRFAATSYKLALTGKPEGVYTFTVQEEVEDGAAKSDNSGPANCQWGTAPPPPAPTTPTASPVTPVHPTPASSSTTDASTTSPITTLQPQPVSSSSPTTGAPTTPKPTVPAECQNATFRKMHKDLCSSAPGASHFAPWSSVALLILVFFYKFYAV